MLKSKRLALFVCLSFVLFLLLALPGISYAQGCYAVAPSNVHHHSIHAPASKSASTTVIPVAFHVLYNTSGTGNLSDSELNSQISVLNSAFSGTRFSFYLAVVSRTQNNQWFSLVSTGPDTEVQQPLAVDPTHVMNVYIGDMPTNAYGWSSFPDSYPAESDWKHGVLVDYVTFPGGPYDSAFNNGDILVHEAGHYLGLLHPYEGGCISDPAKGDHVADTPACSATHFRLCPSNPDSCSSISGLDPINNYMYVTTDACRTHFTEDQTSRMDAEVSAHRPNLGGSVINFTQNLTVASNQAWHFFDSTIKFSSGKSITVNGTLNADDATFTASGSSWNGIYYASGSDGTIDNVDITKVGGGAGNAAVKIYNAEPHIEDSFIDVNTGSYVYGVYMSGSYHTATIYRTNIRSKSAPAVYVSGSYNYLNLYDTNIIQESSYAAVYASNSGRPYFWPGAVSPYVGYDKVKGGRLYASGNGFISAGSASSTTSQNHFCNAASASLEATSGGTIYAKYNYWYNNNDPVQNDHSGSGTIYYSNKLGAANCSDVPYRVIAAGETPFVLHALDSEQNPSAITMAISTPVDVHNVQQETSSDLRARLFEAIEKIRAKRFAEATVLLQPIVESGVMPEAHSALLELGAVFRETRDVSTRDIVSVFTATEGPLRSTALSILAGAYASQQQDEDAWVILDELVRSYPGTTAAFYGQLSLVSLHVDAGRFAEATRVLDAIAPGSQEEAYEVAAVRMILELEAKQRVGHVRGGSQVAFMQQAEVFEERRIEATDLEITSYPNPFNPVATIQYALPSDGQVVLKVYDMLGRAVATLVDGRQAAGTHEVTFEASHLPSGTYLYRLEAAGQIKSGHLLLLK